MLWHILPISLRPKAPTSISSIYFWRTPIPRTINSPRARVNDYDDALRNKKALVIPMILEAFGGISPHSLHFIRRLALRAKGARARDSTVYGGSSTSAKSFFVHHTQQLAAAAQVGDAKMIRKKITEMKMRL